MFCRELDEKLEQHSIQKHSMDSSMGSVNDLHSGLELKSSWWTNIFFSCDTTVIWHSKHTSKRVLSKIKCTSSGNLTMLIAIWQLLLFIHYSAWRHTITLFTFGLHSVQCFFQLVWLPYSCSCMSLQILHSMNIILCASLSYVVVMYIVNCGVWWFMNGWRKKNTN